MAKSPFQYQGYAGLPQGAPALPELTWQPVYPERIPPQPSLLAAIVAGSIFFTPISGNQQQTTGTQGSPQVLAGQQIQYQAYTRPFDPALVAVIAGWGQSPSQPVYPISPHATLDATGWKGPIAPPDIPEPRASGSGGGLVTYPLPPMLYQAYTEPPFQAPGVVGVEWLPAYPDFTRAPAPLADLTASYFLQISGNQQQAGQIQGLPQIFGGQSIQYQAIAAPFQAALQAVTIEWLPAYPPTVERLREPTVEISVLPPFVPVDDLRWLGGYPDQIDRVTVRAVDQVAAFIPTFLPLADLRWQASYPDRVLGLPTLLEFSAFVLDPFPRPTVAETVEWLPSYPVWIDRLLAPLGVGATLVPEAVAAPVSAQRAGALGTSQSTARIQVQYQGTARPLLVLEAAVTLEWLPSYPETIDRLPPLTGGLAVLPPFIPGDLRWAATYPDRVLGLPPLPEFPALVLDPFPRPNPTAMVEWLPSYPDWLASVSVPPSGSIEPPFSVQPLGHLGWQGWQPDQIDRRLAQPWRWPFLALDPFPRPTVVDWWFPTYPERVLALPRAVEYLAFATGQTGSTIPIADLRWLAQFADRVDRIEAAPWLWPFLVKDIEPAPAPPAPAFSWQGIAPAFVRRVVLPVALMPVEVGPLVVPTPPRVPLRITPAPREVIAVAHLQERSSAIYWALLQDEAGQVVPATALTSLVLSLYVRSAGGTITYLRNHQDALNANGVTVYNAVQVRSDGLLYNLRWAIGSLDTGMLDSTKREERHVALWEYVWANGRGKHELVLNIHNLTLVS